MSHFGPLCFAHPNISLVKPRLTNHHFHFVSAALHLQQALPLPVWHTPRVHKSVLQAIRLQPVPLPSPLLLAILDPWEATFTDRLRVTD